MIVVDIHAHATLSATDVSELVEHARRRGGAAHAAPVAQRWRCRRSRRTIAWTL